MDVFNNVLEGTRQYFMGLPKQAQAEGGGQMNWQNGPQLVELAPMHPATPSPRPQSAAPSSTPAPPPRPPSEPLEPEPHIIHKATVMREAAEKRREQPDPEEDEEPPTAISPPTHIIRRPPPAPAPPPAPPVASPAPAPAAPSPSPARPPSAAPSPAAPSTTAPAPPHVPAELTPHSHLDAVQYRQQLHRGHTPTARPPDPFAPGRPPDPYTVSRPPENYMRYPYESSLPDASRSALGPPNPSPPRHGSPQTYARLSSTIPQNAARGREAPAPPTPSQRYAPAPVQPPPLPNDRVPPIHYPSIPSPQQRLPVDSRAPQYPPLSQRREPSPYNRTAQYDRHSQIPSRKYDPQQAYPGYRPTPTVPQPAPPHQQAYKHVPVEQAGLPYPTRPLERTAAPAQPYDSRQSHEASRRAEYNSMSRPVESRPMQYHYPAGTVPASARYAPTATAPTAATVPVQSSSTPSRSVQRPAAAPKSNYEYPLTNHAQTSPARSTVKPGYPNQQARMTVSVTTLVNQMNQTKQKRESPLDLSVKTVKNSADSSTTQDEVVDSATVESKAIPLQPRPTSSTRHAPATVGFAESHKVDFAPDFSQYRERRASYSYNVPPQAQPHSSHHPVRYNGSYETSRPVPESYTAESRHHAHSDRSKYNNPAPPSRPDYVPRIDLTRTTSDERRTENRIRDDRHFIIEERKRPTGPIISNIPEKIVRYETWVADSRIDHMSLSAREQHELMSRPVYSYSSHKQFEAYQNEQKRVASSAHREHYPQQNHRYPPYPEPATRERADYHHYHERTPSSNSRHLIQKVPSHRELLPHHIDPQTSIPADKRVLSILRNSLETKQTGFAELPRPARQIRDVIVIDDDPVEITDLTKEETETVPKTMPKAIQSHATPSIGHHIQMPKAVDSLPQDSPPLVKSSPENDVASRIRTKAELKGLPPSDNILKPDMKHNEVEEVKIVPKSQKQHLFNQIREDLRLESVIKGDKPDVIIPEVKSEPMNIEEIEKDAVAPIKTEVDFNNLVPQRSRSPSPAFEDLDWANACDSFMEQLKSGCHKKKVNRKRVDTSETDTEGKSAKALKVEPNPVASSSPAESSPPATVEDTQTTPSAIVIKQEPVDEDDTRDLLSTSIEATANSELSDVQEVNVVKVKEEMPIQDSPEKGTIIKPIIETPKKEKDKPKVKKLSTPNEKTKSADSVKSNKEKKTMAKKKSCVAKSSVDESDLTDEDRPILDKKTVGAKKSVDDNEITDKDKPIVQNKCTDEKKVENKKPNNEKKVSTDIKTIPTKIKKAQTSEKDIIDKPKLKTKSQPEAKEKKEESMKKTSDEPKLKRKSQPEEKEKKEESIKKTSNDETPSKGLKESKTGKTRKSLTESHVEVKNNKTDTRNEKEKLLKKNNKINDVKNKIGKVKSKIDKTEIATVSVKKEPEEEEPLKTVIKEELESTDDDEPLIKSKMQKEKDMKYQLLKDLSEKSAYVKLECFDVDLNKNTRISIDSLTKDKEDKQVKGKSKRQSNRVKGKTLENNKNDNDQNEGSSTNSDDEDLAVTTRLRGRKSIKTEDKAAPVTKTLVKALPKKENSSTSNSSTLLRKAGFGDGSDFRPGWEEELYRYKRSLRMPPRLIAIPRGRSGGPFARGSGAFFSRGSTSLPDLDPAPLSPAPSLAPSAATDDLYAVRRPDKLNLDSDLESNSSWSAANRLQYDSEASTSTVFSTTKAKKKGSSIVDVLIQKCGKINESNKKRNKDKEDKLPKVIPKSSNANELLPTPSLGLVKSTSKGSLSAKKEKLMEDIFYLGAFRKETVAAFRNDFIKNTEGLLGATEEFAPVVLKSRTRTESRVLKQRATIKEVFGEERPASAPPTSCRDDEITPEVEDKQKITVKKEPNSTTTKPKLKPKQIIKDKFKRRSSSIRDGLRSTKSLKRNDAKGRLLRLKKRNSLMKSLANKRLKDLNNKIKKEKTEEASEDTDKPKEEGSSLTVEGGAKRRLKRLFGRKKYSSGFDYIRKKKKIIRREDTPSTTKFRRPGPKPSPESVQDIQKEIKSWFVNKSVGETHLHRAARLGYTDCVAFCLEKMGSDPSAKDNAGFTPLHVAAARGHVRIGRLLLQYGANVSAAAQGGIRPLHEACENSHVEMMRLLLAYGADPLLGTYAGQTPEELTEGPAARFLKLHIADVQGKAVEPWKFPPPAEVIDRECLGCDPLSSPPPCSPPPPEATMEMQCTEAPLPPFYSLRNAAGQPSEGLWCLMQDVINLLQIKSKESLLKQIHCGSGSPKELFCEIRTQEFLERAQCHQLLCAGEKVNVRASKVALVRVTDKLRQLLKIETVLLS